MLIVQISDTHITAPNKKAYGIAATSDNLIRCIEHINQLKPKPDVVLVTGDVTNANQPDEFIQAKKLLDQLQFPYYVIPGNHDGRSQLSTTFGNEHCPSSAPFINYVIDDYPIHLIAVDSVIEGKEGGELCDTRLSWLDKKLAEDTNKPTVVFMHHPPVKVGVFETDVDGFIGANKLGKVIKKYSNIKRIISGHVHLQTHTLWNGTVVTTAPSVSMELVLDLTLENPSQFALEPPSYLIHFMSADKEIVTHSVTVREIDGPHPFEHV